jgi:uncharacterized protein (TIGR02271 family)
MEQSEVIPVITNDGARGTIVGRPSEADRSQVLVRFDTGEQVFVPPEHLVLQEDGSYHLALSLADLEAQQTGSDGQAGECIVVPVLEEELDVQRRKLETGRVRVSKLVREREELVDEPLLQESVDVERVAINKVIDQPVPVRTEGDTIIVPVLEEVLVVEKRLMLKEELRITRRRTTVSQPQTVTLRSEEVSVERLDPTEAQDRGKERAV